MIKELYNFECAMCGARRRLHIHHIDHDPSNNEIENLILLCNYHHAEMHPEKAWKIIHFGKK